VKAMHSMRVAAVRQLPGRSGARHFRIAGVLIFALFMLPSCLTSKLLDPETGFMSSDESWTPSGSFGGDEVGAAAATAFFPCIAGSVVVMAALALDLVSFPYQMWAGWYPYGTRR
jgi:hypothetical protein